MDLSRGLFGVLSVQAHVQRRSAALVVPEDELFASNGFGFDVLCCNERVEPKVAPPFEGALEALDALGHVVLGCAYVAQDALV